MEAKQINLTNAETVEVTCLHVNESLSVGDTFRLIGRHVAFRAAAVFSHPVAGEMVRGISVCGRFATAARVADTARTA